MVQCWSLGRAERGRHADADPDLAETSAGLVVCAFSVGWDSVGAKGLASAASGGQLGSKMMGGSVGRHGRVAVAGWGLGFLCLGLTVDHGCSAAGLAAESCERVIQ